MPKTKSKLKVAMVAPPWLKIPPSGYGGIENVVFALVGKLRALGVTVELFSTGDSTVEVDRNHWLYKSGQYDFIHRPIYESGPIAVAQVIFALNTIKTAGDFDIIHDHNGFIGPAAMANLGPEFPPVIHTLHGPPFTNPQMLEQGLPDNQPMWQQLGHSDRLYIVPISEALSKPAPKELRSKILPAVHNAVDLSEFKPETEKSDYFITLARFSREKGQHIAVKLCLELDYKLKMAGIVAGISTPRQLLLELANPLSTYRQFDDFRYYSDLILPKVVDSDLIQYVGNLSGERKNHFIANAKALLFPINWEEPFGMAPIEALACGTPVIAFARGALPEIIEHGVNGFLAKSEAEFKKYMTRVDEIDPAACRRSVEQKFSAEAMAQKYLDRYNDVIARHA